MSDSGIDILFGVGGATEGVVAAAALRCMGGGLQGILKPENDDQIQLAKRKGIDEFNKVFDIEELASGDVMFCSTGVTGGSFLEGVKFKSWGAITHSKVMRSQSGTVRDIKAEHHFDPSSLLGKDTFLLIIFSFRKDLKMAQKKEKGKRIQASRRQLKRSFPLGSEQLL